MECKVIMALPYQEGIKNAFFNVFGKIGFHLFCLCSAVHLDLRLTAF